ncbi:rab-GTPase-TBC domain-containing protein [Paraphysoderma sedebokerense]|nr:rab-GTPase-TBC domain-containing protein [Paraphysoderma sedebokerense]
MSAKPESTSTAAKSHDEDFEVVQYDELDSSVNSAAAPVNDQPTSIVTAPTPNMDKQPPSSTEGKDLQKEATVSSPASPQSKQTVEVNPNTSSGTSNARPSTSPTAQNLPGSFPSSPARIPPQMSGIAEGFLSQLEPNVAERVREVGWQASIIVLERFSRVTRVYKETATTILDHPLAKPILPILPRPIQSLSSYTPPTEPTHPLEEVIHEFPGAGLYLAQWLGEKLLRPGGESAVAGEGSTAGTHGSLGQSPVEGKVWAESEDEETECGEFEILSSPSSLPPPSSLRSKSQKLTAELWLSYVDSNFQQLFPVPESSDITTSTITSTLDAVQIESDSLVDATDSNGTNLSVTSVDDVVVEIRKRIFFGGVDPDVRIDVWKYVLGFYDWHSSEIERIGTREAKEKEYHRLKSIWETVTPQKVEKTEWDEWVDRKHRVGLYYLLDLSFDFLVKDVIRTDRNIDFFANAEGNDTSNQEEEEILNPGLYMASTTDVPVVTSVSSATSNGIINPNLIKLRDVLMTYTVYQDERGFKDLGYVQGMSDLCSPILVVMEGDEVAAFWCFVGFMEKMHPNFHHNQQQMHHHLSTLRSLIQFLDPQLYRHFLKTDSTHMFFAFRWLLVLFKREFKFDDICGLWECIWSASGWLCGSSGTRELNWQYFVALAVLVGERKKLMELKAFDEILKYINDLSYHISLSDTLKRAETIFYTFQNKVAHIEKLEQSYPSASLFSSDPLTMPLPSYNSSGELDTTILKQTERQREKLKVDVDLKNELKWILDCTISDVEETEKTKENAEASEESTQNSNSVQEVGKGKDKVVA